MNGRKLVVDQNLTLDGVFDELEEWQMQPREDRCEMLRSPEGHITDVEMETFDSGNVVLTYRPAETDAEVEPA